MAEDKTPDFRAARLYAWNRKTGEVYKDETTTVNVAEVEGVNLSIGQNPRDAAAKKLGNMIIAEVIRANVDLELDDLVVHADFIPFPH